MRYIDVNWHQDSAEYPIRLVSEIDNQNFETRKLEFFSDGHVGCANERHSTEDTELGIAEVPSIDQINADEEFDGKEITAEQFELLWYAHVPAIT